MARWSISRRLDGDVAVQVECDYDPASAEVLASVHHEDVLDEQMWQWRVPTTGEVADVAPRGGTARLASSPVGGEIVLEPKGCLLRWMVHWWLGWEKLRLRLHGDDA